MEESSTYQYIVAKGELREAKKLLMLLGTKRFGRRDGKTSAAIESITDLKRLEQLSQRLLEVSTWQDLLATPSTS